jgi:hypothetical protein
MSSKRWKAFLPIFLVSGIAQAAPPAEVSLPHVIQGRQSYAGQHIMWRDTRGHIHLINSFGGADVAGLERAYIHYINTFTGASALVEGGPGSFGRNSVYDPQSGRFYWYGEYCNRVTGGSLNEFDPSASPPTNRIIKLGGSTWNSGQSLALGADHRVYFTAIDSDNRGGHLYSYDPAVGAESWTDYGVIYGPSNGISPGLYVDKSHIYVSWQDNTSKNYWHLMVHPIGAGSWSEVDFPGGNVATRASFAINNVNKKVFLSRSVGQGASRRTYWLKGGQAVAATAAAAAAINTGYGWTMDINWKHHISMMGYGDYQAFTNGYGYEMNWDRLIPDPSNPKSTVTYGPHRTWHYPASGFKTSSLDYTGVWYDLPVNEIAPYSATRFYAISTYISSYDYSTRTSTLIGPANQTSVYAVLRVPAVFSPLKVDELYFAGYPNQVWRLNPREPLGRTNPLKVTPRQHMNYQTFMEYDSAGTVWIGANYCGATAGCHDFGSVGWYDPRTNTSGQIFASTWTGGNPGDPGYPGTGIAFRNFAMCNQRSKLVVSSNDGKLTVIDASRKAIEGTYLLGANAYMVEVADDKVLGVTTSSDVAGERVFLFRPSTRSMIVAPKPIGVSGNTFGSQDGHIARRVFKLELGPDGHAWLYVDRKIYRIEPATLGFEFVVTDTSDSTKLKWASNGQDLIVYGETRPSCFPGLLPRPTR